MVKFLSLWCSLCLLEGDMIGSSRRPLPAILSLVVDRCRDGGFLPVPRVRPNLPRNAAGKLELCAQVGHLGY